MRYFLGVAVVVLIAVGSLLLFSGGSPTPEQAPVHVPDPVAAAPNAAEPAVAAELTAPEAFVSQGVEPMPSDQNALLEQMASDTRETLPVSVTDTLSMTDAMFLPRMRIMEYTYVTTAVDARASARNMRTLVEAAAERLCLGGREMFGMGVTLRNSFEAPDGTLIQRVYLLPEYCQQFY